MKSKFMTAYKATTLYNEVSNTYIHPGVSWLTGLCFDDTEADFKKGILEIEEKRNELCGGAEKLVDRVSKLIPVVFQILTHCSVSTKLESS